MGSVRLPERITGKWIWKKALQNRPDSLLLFRKEFVCSFVGLETNLWICANCAYQLFINGRLVGFGPRAHQRFGNNYIDQHEITYFLDAGINVISVQVYYNTPLNGGIPKVPGFWCQCADSQHEILKSDESWLIFEGECFASQRARAGKGQGFLFSFQSEFSPGDWMSSCYEPGDGWETPDQITPVDAFPCRLELHPMAPPSIEEDFIDIRAISGGKIENRLNWTQIVFDDAAIDGHATYAACSYIFQERPCEIAAKLSSDDEFKFFCGNRLVTEGKFLSNEPVRILLNAGWNRLLFVQRPNRHGMGAFLVFADDERKIRIYKDMVDTAPAGWNTVGPLRLSLEEATPSLHFESLSVRSYMPNLAMLSDVSDFLDNCTAKPNRKFNPDTDTRLLKTGDYILYRLDYLRYGFIKAVLEASLHDIVDITIGVKPGTNGLVSRGEKNRGTHTVVCGDGLTPFLTFFPCDVLYILISVRHSVNGVRLSTPPVFEELAHHSVHEASFRCSDETLNELWLTGQRTLRRSSGFIPMAEARSNCDTCLLDSYIDSVNVATVFGDFNYMTARLRQFLDAQLENGNIPVLTYDSRHVSQIAQMFFLPVWLNYNYRFGGNLVELEQSVPALDQAREFFETMVDEDSGLLVSTGNRFGMEPDSPGIDAPGKDDDEPTYFNALFCRFLLSAAEIYKLVNQQGSAMRCVKRAQKLAESLWKGNYDEKGQLFSRMPLKEGKQPEYTLGANFYAMYGGVFPLENFEYFFYTFFHYDPPFDTTEEAENPYFHFLFMEMMFALGQRDWAFRYFRDYWSKRICGDTGAWRIRLGSDEPAGTSFNHGKGVSPNVFLLREILGIRIAEAGHSVTFFNPAVNQVDWCEAVISMARGRMKIKWEKMADGSFDVTLESNFPVKIVPEMSKQQLAETTFRLGDKVTLLQPPPEAEESADPEDNVDR